MKTDTPPPSDRFTTTEGQPPPLFEVAAEVIRANILDSHLPPGLVLQESALSERLSMSRAPVKRALAVLEAEGLVNRFSGRGYIVGDARQEPRRENVREMAMDLSLLDGTAGQPNWLRIHDAVEQEASRALVFGQYRVIETLMAETYEVSRTVVRDVLGRLQERGIVSKSASSRWILEPLTARRIRDKFELRMILEVAALRSADHDLMALERLRARIIQAEGIGKIEPSHWFGLVNDFIDLTILSTPNADLASFINTNRKALQASQNALHAIGLPADIQSLRELRIVLDLVLSGTVPAAADMLETHLAKSQDRTIAQLKIVSVMSPPEDLAPYLQIG
ncbi:GntR family transcriptional regulator [Rhodospirillum sp. A1_3_36]|uniref:GntR family transcriptional regulator n=1 Tax=Rhodospirillum sp. A1_3_36 TaxID=3391666 RepID=UPI0039A532F3